MAELDLSRVAWRKSSRSGGNGGNCVEVAAAWKSTASGGECVVVRDSQDPEGAVLAFSPGLWRVFMVGVKNDCR